MDINDVVGTVTTRLFKWELGRDCFSDEHNMEAVWSPHFSCSLNNYDDHWQLNFHPNGESNGFVSLFLRNISNDDVWATFTLSIWNPDTCQVTSRFFNKHLFKAQGIDRTWGIHRFMPRSDILTAKKLIILCKIIVSDGEKEEKNETTCGSSCKYNEFEPSLERLFKNSEFSDVTVKAGKKTFELHKCILSSRSIVFEAMFRTDMEEKNKNEVNITDIESEVLEHLFQFIYTGKVDKIDHLVFQLHNAAEKYCIDGLKKICVKTIGNNINEMNAVDYFCLAGSNNAEQLEKKIFMWMSAHLESLVHREEFEDFAVQRPEFMFKLMKQNILFHPPDDFSYF